MLLGVALLAALVSTGPGSVARTPSTDATVETGARESGGSEAPQAKAAPEKPKLICKRDEVTGSRMPSKKICLTAKQWKELQD